MPFFTPRLFLKKPTETEQLDQDSYNNNMDTIDEAFEHLEDSMVYAEVMSLYKLNKDDSRVFTELQWKREDGTLARKSLLSGGTAPNYTAKTVTYYESDGITVKAARTYALSYDQDNDLISEVLQ
ncbi:MAG: hypothetical protein APF84_05865 [Gracilibacter sp. BRH_c7a]|nr:MAG: hypothetical protein APF84_05865 [Gracilibacter sp. BRH_c7a]